ncbi:MAG: ATP-binding protein, partial [Proteobacteria bacterium]|nr:ATP-binding protein [Pseudomonadota bacterium]
MEVENRPAEGVAVARVIDYGEGMDRRIIDTQLTRLFSSSKEDDLTKIGKFGIGFVSVFSVKPVAVVVDTGKSGEHWRVLFKPDGTFERISLDEPVEGTRVEVYLPTRLGGFNDFLRRSEETVRYWCRHAEAEVFFEG